MEDAMQAPEDFYFLRFEHRPLSPDEFERLRRAAERGAREYRGQLVRSFATAIIASLRRLAGRAQGAARVLGHRTAVIARNGVRAYATWRERRAAIKELAALDDRTLKDLGLTRSEIEFVVCGREAARLRAPQAVPMRHPRAGARSRGVAGRRLTAVIDRSAA
jgi:uncharacterized protein YjiS (DUF1127 family)